MKKDTLFENDSIAEFSFNREVSRCFDDMAARSIPFYQEVVNMNAQLAHLYYRQGTNMYDLGFSTANLPLALSRYFDTQEFSYVGLDSSAAMLEEAQDKIKTLPVHHCCRLLTEDIVAYNYQLASVIFANYTFQFLRPMERLPLLRKLFASLQAGGIFLMSEKVLEKEGDITRQFIELYYRYKKEKGYSDLQISQKREALENVLVPYRMEENMELLKEAGFASVEIFFKWFNFASFIAVKKI